MKIRTGFISNSSSSSFIISKVFLSAYQIELIKNHSVDAKKFGMSFSVGDAWEITDEEMIIRGYTFMDNFDMETYLRRIGVPSHRIEWNE